MQAPSHSASIARLVRSFEPKMRRRIEEPTIRIYLEELQDIPPDVLALVAQDLIRTSEWFPTVSEIRAQAAERVLLLPGEAEALAQIETRMRWALLGRQDDAPPVHPLVREALKHVGGYAALRGSDDSSVIRGQFGRLYRELRARALHQAQTAALITTGERPALTQRKEGDST